LLVNQIITFRMSLSRSFQRVSDGGQPSNRLCLARSPYSRLRHLGLNPIGPTGVNDGCILAL
jgi:hypothetical protein